ncbi:MAG: FdrA family protein [Spirochaetes bacterium GWD1_61_31]|nr:MAG: FdrA family protein [Spirochaetes bacterium GWB1_60_80]OHD35161.1 MAG: FdrA family protein [Spirochaetes bacterium GWC1_61_12]OHD43084.1 MAG: FdrA family protein [Spirochaetes bacterium GWE1_60_18]OHD43518.1 MAG: FdrA family protein [Spirochaetes bacterium GWD1_61_31]OHD59679.1 MAG: FdrA family protein [Spirochaetes bacterium GWF1_60_12]HAP44090.1 FdrA family protein [Spirochaetaceae bacterium]
MKLVQVRKDSYYDSVFLMLASRGVQKLPGVTEAIVAMATPMNLDLLGDLGFDPASLAGLTPNDLIVAIDADDEAQATAAAQEALAGLNRKKADTAQGNGLPRVPSLGAARRLLPDANLALVSVPGAWAAREARKCLEAGLHTLVFSDNVSLEDEIALKKYAVSKDLLLMGPDCGTAIINGIPLCFANRVQRGAIGLVAASGTGLQEVSCLIDDYGAGISQAIGTGGRDLKNAAVGGMTSLLAIKALALDPDTSVIVVVSKPPAPDVAKRVVAALRASGKPAVAHFLGLPPSPDEGNVAFAANLEECAVLATLLADGRHDLRAARAALAEGPGDDRFRRPSLQRIDTLAAAEAARLSPQQKYLRGLYTGGTLADETLFLAHAALGGARSNNQTDPAWQLADPLKSVGHTIVDLGDDIFTVGKPHPMIDPAARADRIAQEGADPACAVLLLDVVLGYGSHADPAGACVEAIQTAKAAAAKRGGYLPVVASVTGTRNDPQDFGQQVRTLEAAGVIVMPSNYRAARLAIAIIQAAAHARRTA